jgi:ribosomal protein S18 acetylase RimI-like enzyme
MISLVDLDALIRQGWPPLRSVPVDGWVVRLSEGITQRANSVLPIASPPDLDAALRRVESLYQEQGLATTFQLSPAAQPEGLDLVLAERGYELRSPTLIQVAEVDALLARLPVTAAAVTIAEQPDEEWMDLWWSVDGRGGVDARAVAWRILTGGPARYISIRDDAGVVAVGRIALVDDWGGIYCMAVRPDARRRGHATQVMRALLESGAELGVRRAWLHVVAANQGARALYEGAGFVTASRYHYRVRA